MLLNKIKIYFLNIKLKNQIEKKYRAKFTSNNLYIARNYLISKGIIKKEETNTYILEYILNNGWISPATELLKHNKDILKNLN